MSERWERVLGSTPPPFEKDEILAAQRDRAAFAPLYERYADVVYGYCLHRLNNPDVAADVTSQVFLKALANIDRFSGYSFRSWLFTIARNAVIDRYRTRKSTDPLEFDLQSPETGPEEIALQSETRMELRNALAHLTDQQQDVVNLRLAGLTGREIADATGLTLGAVKATQARAFAALRQLMQKESQHV